jgi:glycosyltransferase involved in cell wall biosynthesis
MSKKPGISVCFVIKNGIKQGYPFWESLKSCLSFADEVVISEGLSDDGTADYIRKFMSMYSNRTTFRLYTDDWNSFSSPCGEVIAKVSHANFKRCQYEWVYYLQADEVLHDDNAAFVRSVADGNDGYNAVKFMFYHFINSWKPYPRGGAAYDEAIRMVRNRPGILFLGDAWTFHGGIHPVCSSDKAPKPIYHLGWVFPKNCDIKSVEHAELYKDMQGYQDCAKVARERMENKVYEKGFDLPDDFDDFPEGVARLFCKLQYELPDEALK